jgi:hypothetical protein
MCKAYILLLHKNYEVGINFIIPFELKLLKLMIFDGPLLKLR